MRSLLRTDEAARTTDAHARTLLGSSSGWPRTNASGPRSCRRERRTA